MIRVRAVTSAPDELHRSGVFNSYRSTFRLDVDLTAVDNDDADAALPTSLLLTIVSGFDDLGSPTTSEGMGVYGGQKTVPPAGMCGGAPCGGRETKSWMGTASTAVNVVVRSEPGQRPRFKITRARIQMCFICVCARFRFVFECEVLFVPT